MARIITAIAPHKESITKRKNVAAYARVSSGKDAMLHSLSAQVSYYSELIQSHGDWTYEGVYADEAMTGTKMQRPEFQRMLEDCRAGKIDMVITKSISRFARNTVTLLETVRELKAKNVDVYFEEQNIHSMSEDGELMLTILASFAQEESLSVSENCKWRIRNDYKEGRMPMTQQRLYGYKRTADGGYSIVENEAVAIRFIFDACVEGKGCKAITDELVKMDAPPPNGEHWGNGAVRYILSNEKYMGDLLLQKEFTSDHLTKKKTVNRGQLNKYYVENNHEPIVSKDTFHAAQAVLTERSEKSKPITTERKKYPFTSMIVCDNCGSYYKRKVSNCTNKYRRVFWNCSTFLNHGKAACHTKQIPEDTLMKLSAEVLGIPEFNVDIFKERIEKLRVPCWNTIIFVFKDGTEIRKEWQVKSRKWTAEMKAENYEKLRKGHKS